MSSALPEASFVCRTESYSVAVTPLKITSMLGYSSWNAALISPQEAASSVRQEVTFSVITSEESVEAAGSASFAGSLFGVSAAGSFFSTSAGVSTLAAHAARDRTIMTQRNSAIIFFIFCSPFTNNKIIDCLLLPLDLFSKLIILSVNLHVNRKNHYIFNFYLCTLYIFLFEKIFL